MAIEEARKVRVGSDRYDGSITASVEVIIVNWNTKQQLRECLQSIAVAERHGVYLSRVVVVDNGSRDGSADSLERLKLPLITIRNAENCGFAAACNQGAKGSEADYLLFLNPDTRLFKDSISKPVVFMQQPSNQSIGIVGIQLVNENGQISRSCARFPTPSLFLSKMFGLDRFFPKLLPSHLMTDWEHGESRQVNHVMGAFFLIRRGVFEALGGFDERFFVYMEDLDFSLRAYKAGWKSFYLADVQAYHRGGGASERVRAIRLFYSLRSRILYGYKHFGWFAATGLMLGTMILEPLLRITFAVAKRSFKEVQETLNAYFMLWRTMPQWLMINRN